MARSRELRVAITGDPSNLNRALSSVERRVTKTQERLSRASKTAGSTERKVAQSESRLSKFGGKASGVALGLGAGAAAASVVGLKRATDAAVDLGEEVNKTRVVFRGSERDILAWSKSTASGLGISRREALEATGVFGNMLVPMGFARDRAGEMSQRMVELAADMASFNNASPAETLDALRAGIAGESEPLRRFGVFLNDARQKQEALNLGLYNGKGNLDAAARASATYSLILRDTKDAQGDFQRTSGSLANQQRILRAQFEESAATIGRVFLPSIQRGAKALSGFLAGHQGDLDAFSRRMERSVTGAAKSLEDGFRKRRSGGMSTGDALADMAAEGFEKAAPRIADAAGAAAPRAAQAFVKAWWDSGVWGKLLTSAFLIGKFGGFKAAGKWAVDAFATQFRRLLVRSTAITVAGEAAGTAAAGSLAGGMASNLPKQMEGRRGKFRGAFLSGFKGIGVGIGIATGIEVGMGLQQQLEKSLRQMAQKDGILGKLANIGADLSVGPLSALTGLLSGSRGNSGGSNRGGSPGSGGLLGAATRATQSIGANTRITGRSIPQLRGGVAYATGASTGVNPGVKSLASATAGVYGQKVTVGTGKQGHSLRTTSGNISEHSTGDAVDIPARGAELIRMGQSALIAAGADPAWARKQRGGLYNVKTPGGGRAQIIFNTKEGGDHTNHLHIGLKGSLGSLTGDKALNRLQSTARLTPQQRTVQQAARKYGIDPAVLWGVYGAETNFGKNKNRSSAGAQGPFQFMPGTAKSLGIDPNNFKEAAFGAAKYLSQFKGRGTRGMLAAYNAGPAGNPNNAETRAYIPKVLSLAGRFPDLSSAEAGSLGVSGLEIEPTDLNAIARAQAERRLLPIARERQRRIRRLNPVVSKAQRREENFSQTLGLQEQRAGFVDEDIATPQGRATRVAEIRTQAGLTLNIGYQQNRRLAGIRKQIAAWARAVKQQRTLLKRTKSGVQKGVIRGRIQTYLDKIRELQAEAKELDATFQETSVAFLGLQNEAQETETTGIREQATRERETRQRFIGMLGAQAALTPGLQDDVGVANQRQAFAASEYQAAVQSGDPERITDAANELKSAADDLKSAAEALRDQDFQPFRDALFGAQANLVRAQVNTPTDTSDDLQALNDSLAHATAAYQEAERANDIGKVIEFGGEILGLRGSIESLTTQVQQATETQQELLELEKQKNADLRRTLSTSQAQGKQMVGILADLVSGQLGGRVGLGAASVSVPGRLASY